MEFLDVLNQLQDIPSTFKKTGPFFTAFENSIALGLSTYTNATDGVMGELSFQNASFYGIGMWGSVLGIIQDLNESDTQYSNRITNTLEAWFGTIPGLLRYMEDVYGLTATITENSPGYTISISTPSQNTPVMISNLKNIRPAGVPFSVDTLKGGLFLNTVNYLGSWRSTGAYLSNPVASYNFTINSYTNNATAVLPLTLSLAPLTSLTI